MHENTFNSKRTHPVVKEHRKNPENPNGKRVVNGGKKTRNLSHLRSKILSLKKGKSNLQCAWWDPLRPKPLLKSTLYSKIWQAGEKICGKKNQRSLRKCVVFTARSFYSRACINIQIK